jgi:hypothetical protein
MKVTVPEKIDEILEVGKKIAATHIIKDMEEDTSTAEDYAMQVMRVINKRGSFQIFNANATICLNHRVENAYYDGSFDLDVWVEFIAFDSFEGAYEVGICLTDIWSITIDTTAEDLRKHMYINAFTKHEEE